MIGLNQVDGTGIFLEYPDWCLSILLGRCPKYYHSLQLRRQTMEESYLIYIEIDYQGIWVVPDIHINFAVRISVMRNKLGSTWLIGS
jgi:hypothetical protein